MSEIPVERADSNSPSTINIPRLMVDLSSGLSAIKAFLVQGENTTVDSLREIPSLLVKAQETVYEVEKQLQESNRRLKEALQIVANLNELKSLLDGLPVGIFIVQDPQNQTVTVNPAGAKMLGLSPGADTIKLPPALDSLPFRFLRAGKEIQFDELPMQVVIPNEAALSDIELDVQHEDGKINNLIIYACPLYNDQGSVSGSLSVMVDITERKFSEKRLAMLYNIAHILAESNTINKAAPLVLQMICNTVGWEFGAFWRVEPGGLILTNKGVWNADNINLSEYGESIRYSMLKGDESNLPGYVFCKGESLILGSLQDFHSMDISEAEKAGLQSAYIFPVRSGENVIAILEFLSNHNRVHDQNLAAMLNAVGNQIGVFLERKLIEESLAIQLNQQHFMDQANLALSTSLELENRLLSLTHMIVPELADWCAIDTIDQNNILRRVAAAHVDASKEELLFKIQPTRTIDAGKSNGPQIQAILTGKSLLFPEITFSLIEETIQNPDQLELVHQLNPISSIVVPLLAHNKIIGICSFVYSDSGRRYSATDLPLAEELMQRTALAMDNAFLYAESKKHNAELEQRVDERTVQLRIAINQLTAQIAERQKVEEQVRILNSELEQRIAERTSQLEIANHDLNKELIDRKRTGEKLKSLLKQTRELYRISQTIGIVRTPTEVLGLLLSSSYLKDVSRASIGILDTVWLDNGVPPEYCFILAEWNRGIRQPKFMDQRFTLEEYGVRLPVPYGQPIEIPDIQSVMELPDSVRQRFADLRTHSLIILPLIAGGEWYGLLSLHFKTRRMTNREDLRHVRGLVDESAIVIKNMRLLKAESQARQEAERANDLKLKFLGMISHELRTPLTSIKGFATTLLADDVIWPPDKQRDFLETINIESDKLHDLIEQLLDLSRIEAGIMRITPKKISLNKVLESALPQLKAITIEHKLIVNLPPDLPLINGDSQRIIQVLTNLVSNATKFSPPQTEIIVSVHTSGNEIRVDVADHGPGIPLEDRLRIFAAFYQLENGNNNRTKGAGLGLAICKGLIEAHNGKIWIQDHLGPGTVVSFTLPIILNNRHTYFELMNQKQEQD